jgi:hypothetical protein
MGWSGKKFWGDSPGWYGGVASGGGGGGSSPTIVFQSQTAASYVSGSSQSVTGVAIGPASANRRVIVVLIESTSYNAVTDITVGGTSVGANFHTDKNTANSYNGQISYGWIDVPTGTTATIGWTGGGTAGDEPSADLYVYTVDKTTLNDANPVISTPSIGTAASDTTATNTVNTQANGFIIASLSLGLTDSTSGPSITSSTETYTTSGTPTSKTMSSYKASGAAANTPTSVTWGWTTNAHFVASIFTWR